MGLCEYQEIGLQDINNYTRWYNGLALQGKEVKSSTRQGFSP